MFDDEVVGFYALSNGQSVATLLIVSGTVRDDQGVSMPFLTGSLLQR